MLKSRFTVERIERQGGDPLTATARIFLRHAPSRVADEWRAEGDGTIHEYTEYTAENCEVASSYPFNPGGRICLHCIDGAETKEFDLGMEVEITITPIAPSSTQDGETGL